MEVGDILRKVHDTIFHRPMNFSFVDDYVCGSARIMSKRDVDWLIGKGIKAIISVTEDPIPNAWLNGSAISYKHVPVMNHRAPSPDQLARCVEFIEENIRLDNKTLVHCAAGKGRTGTVLAAYICSRDNISAESSIEKIRSQRSASVEKNPASGQEEAVKSYELSRSGKTRNEDGD